MRTIVATHASEFDPDGRYISPKTVDAHLRAIYPKLGVRRGTELELRFKDDG